MNLSSKVFSKGTYFTIRLGTFAIELPNVGLSERFIMAMFWFM